MRLQTEKSHLGLWWRDLPCSPTWCHGRHLQGKVGPEDRHGTGVRLCAHMNKGSLVHKAAGKPGGESPQAPPLTGSDGRREVSSLPRSSQQSQ